MKKFEISWDDFEKVVQRFRKVVNAKKLNPHKKVYEYVVLYSFTVCMRHLFDLLLEARSDGMGLAELVHLLTSELPDLDEEQLGTAGMTYAGLRHYHSAFSMKALVKHQVPQNVASMCGLLEKIVELKVPKKAREQQACL